MLSPGHKARRAVVWGRGWTLASSPQFFRARNPYGSVSARGAEAAREVRPLPSQDPGPSLGLEAERQSQATSGDFAHQCGAPKGGRRPAGVKVQEEVQPLPSFLRSEHTEPGAAAPPLRRRLRLAWGRAHPAAATARPLQPPPPPPPAKLPDPARAATPVRAPPPPPSPFVSSAPAPPPRLALCRGRSARPQRAREKPRRARACAADPSSSSFPRVRAPLGCAPAPPGGREGRWQARLQEGLTSSFAYPPEGRPRRGGGRAERRDERAIQRGWGWLCGG
nr:proline-rich receptor-like protein kinase PERK9 [Microcebus murinus]